jgi:tRNA(Ile)-lysidine synthase
VDRPRDVDRGYRCHRRADRRIPQDGHVAAVPRRQAAARARALTPGDGPSGAEAFAELLDRCTFPPPRTTLHCAFSGGTDSTALIALARAAGLRVTAHHVDHGIRAESRDEAEQARRIATELGVPFELHRVTVAPGPNLEARARAARRRVLPEGCATGHTADDQAETVLLRLLRGSGSTGLGAIRPGPTHPILALRRADTAAVCRTLGLDPVHDASNDVADVWRNRVRSEALPLLTDIAGRDLVPILDRTAALLRDDSEFLDRLATDIDPTDAAAVAAAPVVLARRAVRCWLVDGGYPPDAAAIERVLDVARGRAVACELPGGRRVERSNQRLRVVGPSR